VDTAVGASPAWSARELTKDWSSTAVVSAGVILLALPLSHLPLIVDLAVGTVIAIALSIWAGRAGPMPLVLALIPATILANSGLMPTATYFLPTAILGLGLVFFGVASFARTRSIPPLPWRPLAASAVLYLAAAVLSTAFSIRPATSIPYLLGIVIILAIIHLAMKRMKPGSRGRSS